MARCEDNESRIPHDNFFLFSLHTVIEAGEKIVLLLNFVDMSPLIR